MKYLILGLFLFVINFKIQAQCIEKYSWAIWNNFEDSSATGSIKLGTKIIAVNMKTNYKIVPSTSIFELDKFFKAFSGYSTIPKSSVPSTTFETGALSVTTFCFSEPVTNPVFLLATLGNVNDNVTLTFSEPYESIYDAGGINYINKNSLKGIEGNAIIKFQGTFTCLIIKASIPEFYTNLTFALTEPTFPVSVSSDSSACNSVTLKAKGGKSYKWDGGNQPNSANNTFYTSGNYKLTSIDSSGCEVIILKNISINNSCINGTIAPSVFTPNNDGINDQFKLTILDAIISDFQIYNRWGELVYSDLNPNWDGKYRGKDCPTDTYNYVVKYKNNSSNKILKYSGRILLIK